MKNSSSASLVVQQSVMAPFICFRRTTKLILWRLVRNEFQLESAWVSMWHLTRKLKAGPSVYEGQEIFWVLQIAIYHNFQLRKALRRA